MCKHVAATLYGVGARLDQQPELLFRLRGVDAAELVVQASADVPKAKKGPASKKRLDDSLLADVFGIDLVDAPPAAYVKKDAKPDGKRATTQGDKKRSIPRTPQSTSTEPAKKPSKTAKPVKASASSREATAKPRSSEAGRKRTASAPETKRAKNETPKAG